MANVIFNRVVQTVASAPGTGNITLSNAVAGYQTLAQAGSVDATTTAYLAEDGTMWEYGSATISSSGTVLARSVTRSYNGSTFGSSAVSLTANAIITITPRAEDLTSASTINSGVLAVSYGGTGLTSLTAGYIPYGNGTGAFSSSSNLFWDGTNSRLGIGTSSPSYLLDVNGAINCQNFNLTGGGYPTQNFYPTSGTANQRAFRYVAGGGSFSFISIDDSGTQVNYPLTIYWNGNTQFGGNLGIGTSSPGAKLSLVGNSQFQIAGGSGVYGTNITYFSGGGDIGFAIGNSSSGYVYQTVTTSHALTFGTNNTERARIDSSGNLLVGTTSSAAKMVVATTSSDGNVSTWGTGQLLIAPGGTSTSDGLAFSVDSTNHIGYISSLTPGAQWNTLGYRANVHVFYKAGYTEAARIDVSGNLLVGQSSQNSTEKFGVTFTAGNAGIYTKVASTATQYHITFNNGSVVGAISTNGSATTYSTSSDISLKTNIANAANSLSSILALPVRQFDWKADGSHTEYGVVAQEVYKYAPEMVTQGDLWSVDYGRITPRLIKAFQELAAKVSALEAKQ